MNFYIIQFESITFNLEKQKYIQKFCDYIEINLEEFWKVANEFRGPIWIKNEINEWYNTYWDLVDNN